MFCEKCGTDNKDNATVCSRCGEKMPASSFCGGFADILSYEDKIPTSSKSSPLSSASSPVSESHSNEIRKLTAHNAYLEKKIENLYQKFLIAIGVAVLALILAIVCLFITPSSSDVVDDVKNTPEPKEEHIDIKDSSVTEKENPVQSTTPSTPDDKTDKTSVFKMAEEIINEINK